MAITLQANDVVVFAGDSLTFNGFSGTSDWATSLNAQIQSVFPSQGITLVNAGVGGNDSAALLARISSVIALNPTVAIIWIGINDVAELEVNTPFADAQPMVRAFQTNMQGIINALKAVSTIRVIALVTPFLLGEQRLSQNRGDAYVEPVRECLYQLSVLNSVEFIDMRQSGLAWDVIENTGNLVNGVLTTDGAHPNALGASVVSGAYQHALGVA